MIKRRKAMFTDYVKIHVKAGNGGNGAVRELIEELKI